MRLAQETPGRLGIRVGASSVTLWVVAATAFALGFVVLGVLVTSTPGPTALDLSLTRAAANLATTPIYGLILALNLLGEPLIWIGFVALAAIALLVAQRRVGAVMLVAGLGTELPIALAKLIFARERPVPDIALLLSGLDHGSYPSGHVARVVVLAAVVVLAVVPSSTRMPALVLGLVATLLMAVARVSSLQHWPTDAIGAVALALSYVCALTAIARRFHLVAPTRADPRVGAE